MSNTNKLTWLVLVLLLGCIWWLVFVDLARSGAIERFESKTSYSEPIVPVAYRLQPTKAIQKTQSGAMLHRLSIGVEMRPIDMLRDGRLLGSEQLGSENKGLTCVYNCDDYQLMLDSLR